MKSFADIQLKLIKYHDSKYLKMRNKGLMFKCLWIITNYHEIINIQIIENLIKCYDSRDYERTKNKLRTWSMINTYESLPTTMKSFADGSIETWLSIMTQNILKSMRNIRLIILNFLWIIYNKLPWNHVQTIQLKLIKYHDSKYH